MVVPRRDVGVADRPVHPEPVARVGAEVEVAPAVHLAAPHDGAAADLAAPDPVKRLGGSERVRGLAVVDEELAAVLVARVAVALHELVALQRLAVAPPAELHPPWRHALHLAARRIERP